MANLPRKITLPALKKQWRVTYVESTGKLILIEHPSCVLALYGKHYTRLAALALINRWVRVKAHNYLTNMVKQLNRRVKARYKKIVVRSHDAQWGCYLPSRTISLNYKLIFLPTRLIKNIIYHELCHARYDQHSKKFWQELAKFDRNWKHNNREIDSADDYIPKWVIL